MLFIETPRKNEHGFLNGLIQSHLYDKNFCHFSTHAKLLGERGEQLYLVIRNKIKILTAMLAVTCWL